MKIHNFNRRFKTLIIAEIGINHGGNFQLCKKMITAAKTSGADAVKLQSYTPDTITLKSSNPEFQIKSGLWKGQTLWDLYKKAQTPFKWHKELFEYAKKINIVCFSSPFDESAVDLFMDVTVAHLNGTSVGVRCVTIDIDSASHLRRLLELNLGDADLLSRELTELSE